MFKTKVFPRFQNTENATKHDRAFLSELVRTREETQANFVCFSIFDFDQSVPNQQNYLTYPMEWVSHYLRSFYSEIDPLLLVDFRQNAVWDWRGQDCKSEVNQLFDNLEAYGLGRNGISLAHHIRDYVYGVLSLSFEYKDEDWIVQKVCKLQLFQGQAARITRSHEAIYQTECLPRYQITNRESQCLKWVALGKTDQQIARQMGIARWTVTEHIKNAKRKLEAPSRAAAVAVALTHGIFSI